MFPTLTLEQVYGAIMYYLGYEDEVDRDTVARESSQDAFRNTQPAPELKDKLARARRQLQSR